MTSIRQPAPDAPDDGAVLAGVKARPYGRPAAGLDPGCGRHPIAPVGSGQKGRSSKQDPPNESLYGSGGLPR